jgi:N-methylhydantoinase B
VLLAPPSGAGFGDPFKRPVEAVLADVVSGYVSIEAAACDYGVVVRYVGKVDQLVRLPEHYVVDEEETARLRAGH